MMLVAWRENTARTKHRPRKWIISDHALVKISRLNPETLEALKNINTDNDVNYDKFANDILDVIQGL
jgi:ribonuclease D